MAATEAVVSSQEVRSTLLIGIGDADRMTAKDIKEALEKGDTKARATALENMIRLHLNGESQNHMIMTVIKYITPVEDHLIKKLVLYFWEVVDRTDKDGNLLSVMILICSFLRNDLQHHPNEYVRGLTLRFLCKVKERDLVEPLIGPVLQNLKHSESYVRRNAVLAVHAIYGKFPDLMPDAPEQIEELLLDERDVSTRRNGFDMLAKCVPDRAAHFLSVFRESSDLVESGSVFLLSVVDFCQQAIRLNPYDRARYVPILFAVLQSKNPAVRFQCAATLLTLSSSPTALREATLTFVDILKTHSDNSVRLIVIEKLDEMRKRYLSVLQSAMLDILSTLPNSSTAIRQRVITFAVELVTSKNMDAFVQAVKRELGRATGDSADAASVEYKQVLVRALSTALIRRPQCGSSILPVLLDNMCDSPAVGSDVMVLVKEVLRSHPELREQTMHKLRGSSPSSPRPASCARCCGSSARTRRRPRSSRRPSSC
ncbi:coatomer beta subunit [Strigomonas culicis]|uniref:Coatomer beta subunit n=1 Tax=Strigomonas culicis TaxID=28005 RepID=S9UU77_9TRYP|nr:coatomer beta subunit [Strigomonas culicis]|eukprot:EPY32438.1 coatomer beta subunit [Strigomonas culicis]